MGAHGNTAYFTVPPDFWILILSLYYKKEKDKRNKMKKTKKEKKEKRKNKERKSKLNELKVNVVLFSEQKIT